MRTLLNRIVLLALAAGAVRADNILIAFDDPNQTGVAGQTLSFFGVITNTDATPGDTPIYLNQDSFTFNLSDATIDDNFFAPYYPISLAEGESSAESTYSISCWRIPKLNRSESIREHTGYSEGWMAARIPPRTIWAKPISQ